MQSSDSNSLDNSNDTKNIINIIKKDDDEYISDCISEYNKENMNTEDSNNQNSNKEDNDFKEYLAKDIIKNNNDINNNMRYI
jgi:hypothetical protein